MAGILDLLQAASNSAASNVSGPVDALAWLLRKAGIPIPEAPVGGSDWMAQKGLTRPVEQGLLNVAGETAGLVSPMVAAAKAPQIAKGLLQMGENAAAPANVNRGMSVRQRGIFGGELAQTADKAALSKAQTMEKAGADQRSIWSETGWFKGGDGKWRFEIDDSNSRLLENKAALEFMSGLGPAEYPLGPISNILEHKAAGAAYPDAMAIKARMKKGDSGAYLPSTGFGEGFDLPSKGTHSVALHELQHAIQGREGFASGGSPSGMALVLDDLAEKKQREARRLFDLAQRHDPLNPGDIVKPGAWDKAVSAEQEATRYRILRERINSFGAGYENDAYRLLAGEAEARAVQARMSMTPAQRRATFPLDSYDVPIGQLIYK